jgi:hypothetical protein
VTPTVPDRIPKTAWMIAGPECAAVKLGLKRTGLIYKMKKLGIVRHMQGPRVKSRAEALHRAESTAVM